MKSISLFVVAACFTILSGCKKESIPDFEEGKGRVKGTTDSGFNFDLEGSSTFFSRVPAGRPGSGDDFDNVNILVIIDNSIGRHFAITIGDWKGKGEYFSWTAGVSGTDGTTAGYINQAGDGAFSTQDLVGAGGAYIGEVEITRVNGNYIEGNYDIRMKKANADIIMRIEGNFQGKLLE